MIFSENWLRELVNPDIDTNTMLDQLTMAGLEVDGVKPCADFFTKVVVAEVVDLQAHPDADSLQVAEVNVGSEVLQIVCGASNIRVGMKTPAALVGAVLPGNFKIKKSKLRGVESLGMLCSEKELGLADDAAGLLELPDDVEVGKCLRELLSLDDSIIEVDLTPNRGDCLSILGVARELGVINKIDVKSINVETVIDESELTLPVDVVNTDSCQVYLGRVIADINPQATTPLWMQEKLRRGGIRSLGPLVDVTNFVMLELGQPMHAFDLDSIAGKITVRDSKDNETLKLLDGKEIELNSGDLVIADDQKILALAGVMGGKYSGVTESTKNIFLECAFFEPVSLAGVARKYGMHTDSSHRFERGVDYDLQNLAINRATNLLIDIVGGKAGAITEVNNCNFASNKPEIKLNKNKVEKLLGVNLEDSLIVDILSRLGMKVTTVTAGEWLVLVPSFRFDINIDVDLIEELGRIYGYNNIPSSTISVPNHITSHNEATKNINDVKQFFVSRDYQEVITYSFVNPKIQSILGISERVETLANPISQDLSQMRSSLWPGLLQATAYNINRQHKRIRLFESGLRFFNNKDNELQQVPSIAGLVCGNKNSNQWGKKTELVDFFDVKYDLECLLIDGVSYEAANHTSLHPGQTAKIVYKGVDCGFVGKIHPKIAAELDVLENTFLFEIDLDVVLSRVIPNFKPLSKFPAIKRDLALVLDLNIPSYEIISVIKSINDDLLQEAVVIDTYIGDSLPKNKQSLTISVVLQHHERTLIDEDIDKSINCIIKTLQQKLNANLRE